MADHTFQIRQAELRVKDGDDHNLEVHVHEVHSCAWAARDAHRLAEEITTLGAATRLPCFLRAEWK